MPPQGGPPRSTPIPGSSTPIPGTGPLSPGVPTPDMFLGNQGFETPPPVKVRKDRNYGFWIIAALIFIPTVLGIGAAIWGVFVAKDAVDKANDVVDSISIPNFNPGNTVPNFNPGGTTAGGGAGTGDTVVSQLVGGGMAATVAALDAGIPGDPTNFTEIILYPGYAFGTAQDPVQPDHLDTYMLQNGILGAPAPQPNDPEAVNNVFTIDAVQWDAIAALAADAPRQAAVEEGAVTHIYITRDVFTDVHDVVVRIYVSGPRGSAFIEATPDGTVLRIV